MLIGVVASIGGEGFSVRRDDVASADGEATGVAIRITSPRTAKRLGLEFTLRGPGRPRTKP